MRGKVVAEFVSDERVVALFAGQEAAKDRVGMHAVLWNWYCFLNHLFPNLLLLLAGICLMQWGVSQICFLFCHLKRFHKEIY